MRGLGEFGGEVFHLYIYIFFLNYQFCPYDVNLYLFL